MHAWSDAMSRIGKKRICPAAPVTLATDNVVAKNR